LTATPSACQEITLNWTDNSSNEDHFNIERSGNNITFQQIDTVPPNTTTYVSTLISGGIRYYRVRAHNAGGFSDYSNTANTTATTCATPTPTPSPTPTPTPSRTPTPSPTPTPTPTPTATVTPTPTPQCTVPNFIGIRLNRAQALWNSAGFTTTVITIGAQGQAITSQSLPPGYIGSCTTTTITLTAQ